MMKYTTVIINLLFFISIYYGNSQNLDLAKAPLNPVGHKWHKSHFGLKGDIYYSSGNYFDKEGKLTKSFTTTYYYENGKPKADNFGNQYFLDQKGNVIKLQSKSGTVTTYLYNSKNLLTEKQFAHGNTYKYSYDNNDRLIKTQYFIKDKLDYEVSYSYKESGDVLIVESSTFYTSTNTTHKSEFQYRNGNLIKQISNSKVTEYSYTYDSKGNANSSKSYFSGIPETSNYFNRYYDDINKEGTLEFGYYLTLYLKTKMPALFLNGIRLEDIKISKGVRPNEQIAYDGLKNIYYSIKDVDETNKSLSFRKPVSDIISRNSRYLSYAYDGKFINYVDGLNSVKAREFSYLGPHMIDYRKDQELGFTYIVDNYKNIKDQPVKPMRLFTKDTASILYTRDRESEGDKFFVVVKGEHMDYSKGSVDYLDNGDAVVFIDKEPKYVLPGFQDAKTFEVKLGKPYDGELDEVLKSNSEKTSKQNDNLDNALTESTAIPKSNTNTNCIEGDCINGWGKQNFNTATIEGTYVNGKIDGLAYVSYTDGAYYHGEYKNDKRNGTGYYKWSNGVVYIGQWKDGNQHGYGYTMNNKNEITSAGIFENGKLKTSYATDYLNGKTPTNYCQGNCTDGFGMVTYNNGDKYWGFFKNNQRFAIGTYLWANNSMYTGSYTQGGQRNGYGIYTYVDQSVFKGFFVNDKIDGLGVMKYNSTGNVVSGVFNNKGAKIRKY